ncbi:Hypothetical_protein [Hexamita inflata]|uniref:Hypothetical_protein n=1 Tax=Hexamita inflata TaxID=28002 RepID=A0AA86TUN8_9EUKA|nr:Hypothetical protein HINF_LOCUS15452 [Hexamita inflata]
MQVMQPYNYQDDMFPFFAFDENESSDSVQQLPVVFALLEQNHFNTYEKLHDATQESQQLKQQIAELQDQVKKMKTLLGKQSRLTPEEETLIKNLQQQRTYLLREITRTRNLIQKEQLKNAKRSPLWTEQEKNIVLDSISIKNGKVKVDERSMIHLLKTKSRQEVENFATGVLTDIMTNVEQIQYDGDKASYLSQVGEMASFMGVTQAFQQQVVQMCAHAMQ